MDKSTEPSLSLTGQMSLAFAISLNIEGQLNVLPLVSRAIEALVIWTVLSHQRRQGTRRGLEADGGSTRM